MRNFISSTLLALLLFFNTSSADDSWKLYDDTQVDVIEITVDADDLEWIYAHVESDSLHLATVHYSNEWFDEIIEDVGFRLRGNTSRTAVKKSFKLDFNHFVSGRDFHGVEKINLNGEHNDPSIVRSKLCWDLYQDIHMVVSRATHAAVYVNGNYYGLYISVEHIDDTFLEKNYSDDSGNLWKCIWPADLTYRGDDAEAYHPYHDEERPYSLKTNKDEYDFTQLARLIRIINQTPDGLLADSLEKVLHVEEVLKYFAMNILVGGWDDYWFLMNNYYLYHEPNENRFHWIPYDYDNTFGIDWFGIDWTTTNPYDFPIIDDGPRPLAERIMGNNQYRDLYSHFIQYFLENVYPLPIWEERIDALYNTAFPWAQIDEYRTYDYGFTLNDFFQSYSSNHYENQHVKRGIKEFVNARVNSFSGNPPFTGAAPIVYAIDWNPKHPQPEDSIYVTIAAFGSNGLSQVTIRYFDAPVPEWTEYPMIFNPITDTKIVENTDRWTGVIPPLGTGVTGYFDIFVEDNIGQTQTYPRQQKITLQTPTDIIPMLFINEFLAKNDAVNTDEAGEYDDWIELYNSSDEDLNLSGMYLTDKPDNLTKWQFPFGGVILEAGEHLLIWCDEDQEQGLLHTNFKLSAGGEFIALTADDGVTVLDSITFATQSADISFGRMPDGTETWMQMTPSPSEGNVGLSIDDNTHPTKFELSVYPNPFNPKTVISYQLSVISNVTIQVYDITGRLVEILVSGEVVCGNHTVKWDASQHSSGVYFVQIIIGNHSNTRKVLLLK
ncbi:MAG: CotH kinase family protein [Candidatus Marinimicrobia bacterium]|nr:CotH kinase family protein [Candidatus Neomarinimicrobiota bacterium]MBL7059582.1 CotH kinase family protein [Candidatus Neomarinimicrobiota bacterium]